MSVLANSIIYSNCKFICRATLISNSGSMSDIIKGEIKDYISCTALSLLHRDVVQKTRTDDHLALSTVCL